jgi:thiosulfate/3-mercaptopyruvate sulfurtransferase
MARHDVVVGLDEIPAGAQWCDVRWRLGDPPDAGRQAYLAGHVPGARFLDLEAVLTGHGLPPSQGRHPLPDLADVAAGLGQLGLVDTDPIVVYDVPGSFAAGRAWWVLRWAGLDVRVFDGGWPGWLAAGGAVETGQPTWAPTRLVLSAPHLPTIDAAQAAAWPGTLIDARAPERYRGEVEPIDPLAGHSPGARNLPASPLWTDQGRLPDEAFLRQYFSDLTPPLAVYCGSGVSAAQSILALATLGVEAALYPPSWSGWSADPANPVAAGPESGA